MIGPASLALAWIMAHAAAGTLEIADIARVQARRAEVGDGAWANLQNTPHLALQLAWPTTTFDAAYAPRFLWVDVGGADASPTLVLHTALLQLALHQPRYTLSLSQTGIVGDQDFAQVGPVGTTIAAPATPLPGTEMAPPSLDLQPREQVISVASEETIAGLRYDWSRRIATEFQVSGGFSGGSDAQAQLVLPRQRAVMLDVTLDFRASHRDLLSTALNAAQVHTSNGYDHYWVSLMETWGTSWAHSSGGDLGLGIAVQDTIGPMAFQSTEAVPVGTASAWYTMLKQGMETRFQWLLNYGPYVDVLAGTLQSRLSTSAQASLTIERSTLRGSAGVAQTFPVDDPDASTVISTDLMFEQELADWLKLQLGGQITWQSADDTPSPWKARDGCCMPGSKGKCRRFGFDRGPKRPKTRSPRAAG